MDTKELETKARLARIPIDIDIDVKIEFQTILLKERKNMTEVIKDFIHEYIRSRTQDAA